MNRRTSVRVHEAQKGESHMKQTAMLTTASLLTILLMTFHMAGDILFKMAPAGLVNLLPVFIFVVQLYGTLVLAGRRPDTSSSSSGPPLGCSSLSFT